MENFIDLIEQLFIIIVLKFNQNSMRSCLMAEWIIKYYVNEVNTIRKAKLFYRCPVLLVQGSSLSCELLFRPDKQYLLLQRDAPDELFFYSLPGTTYRAIIVAPILHNNTSTLIQVIALQGQNNNSPG